MAEEVKADMTGGDPAVVAAEKNPSKQDQQVAERGDNGSSTPKPDGHGNAIVEVEILREGNGAHEWEDGSKYDGDWTVSHPPTPIIIISVSSSLTKFHTIPRATRPGIPLVLSDCLL